MKNVTKLIDIYGENALLNGKDVKVFPRMEESSFFKRSAFYQESKKHTSLFFSVIYTKEVCQIRDFIEMNGKNYRVYEVINYRVKGEFIYAKVALFEDDFTNDIAIYNQNLENKKFNKPVVDLTKSLKTKARIESIEDVYYADDNLDYAIVSKNKTSHKFSIIYPPGGVLNKIIRKHGLVYYDKRSFEIKNYYNVNEKNVIIVIYASEVLNVNQKII